MTTPNSTTTARMNPQIDKSAKYDRQLRLWQNSGQKRLENAHICLINASTTGSETLKNLVLPGIGSFTIVDPRTVGEEDLSGNFFLDSDDIGSNIASVTAAKLCELNLDVKGHIFGENLAALVLKPAFFDAFDVVVVSDYIEGTLLETLKSILWTRNVPLLVVNTVGFYGSVQLVCPETTVIDTHYPSRLYDLRIDRPWPELKAYVDSVDLSLLDDTDHAHVPYIVIFVKALASWKADHKGERPKNYAEKRQFKLDYLETLSRDMTLEGNFIEASQSYLRALQVTEVPPALQELFSSPRISDEETNLDTDMFWIYIRALKQFVAAHDNQLPLPGNLPDMASDTVNYITVQNLYRSKAHKDQEDFANEVMKILHSIGRSEADTSQEAIASFCKNALVLHVAQGSKKPFNLAMLKAVLEESIETTQILGAYFAILTLHMYIDRYLKVPGTDQLHHLIATFIEAASPTTKIEEIPESLVAPFQEILAHGSRNYHNISSLVGGVASQEVLKLVTSQYIPVDNLFVFDGIHSVSEKWKI